MNRKYRRAGIAIFYLMGSAEVWACEHCRPLVKSGVYNADFIANCSLLMLPLGILAALGVITHHLDAILSNLQPQKGDKHGE